MIELRVLGPISLRRADGSNVVALLSQPKRLALTTYLAAPPPHGGRCYHRKDTLVAMFWPELDQSHARAALRNTLYFLRQHLGPASIVTENDVVGIDPHELWCDLDAFDVAVRRRDHATAYQLYRGGLLDGLYVSDSEPFEEWLDAQRQRRSAEARDAVVQAARRHAAAGRVDEAMIWARRARIMAPTNEDAARLLIALRFVTGDRSGALDEYKRLEGLLNTEHGVAPSADTQRLERAIRDPMADAASVANAIAQLPLPASVAASYSRTGVRARARVYDRSVLEAFMQKRVGLAHRRGNSVPVIFVSYEAFTDLGEDPNASNADRITRFENIVLGAIRVADLVSTIDNETLAILPADDGAVDVNALVNRLNVELQGASRSEHARTNGSRSRVAAIWLDPAVGGTADELLAGAIASR